MSCKNCGRQNPSGSLYCQDCGQRLGDWVPAERPGAMATPPTGLVRDAPLAEVVCSRCGTRNAPHMRFCNNCGMALSSGPVSPPSSANSQSGMVSAAGYPGGPVAASLPMSPSAPAIAAAGFPAAGAVPQLPMSPPGAGRAGLSQGAPPNLGAPPALVSGSGAPPRRSPQLCWRCRAEGDAGADFCKFCGARYADDPGGNLGAPSQAHGHAEGAGNSANIATTGPVGAPPVVAAAPAARAPMVASPLGSTSYSPPIPEEETSVGNFRASSGRAPTHMDGSRVPSGEQGLSPRALLVAILKDGSDGRIYAIHDEQTDLGRLEGHIVLADDPYLSPRHVRVITKGDALVVRDLDSLNGVYVRVREPFDLQDGDMVLLGQQVMRFEVLPELELPLGPATQRGVMVFGTPEVPRMARLIQYTTEGVGRDVHYLYRDETVVGREQGDIVCTDDPFMSRRHAAITLDRSNRRFVLRDLGSSNGTAIRIRGERSLRPGDQFRVGRHLFRYDKPGTRNDGAGGRSGA